MKYITFLALGAMLLLTYLLMNLFDPPDIPRRPLSLRDDAIKAGVVSGKARTAAMALRKKAIGSRGVDLCLELEHLLNRHVPYTVTRCIPSVNPDDSLSFMVVSGKPIFSIYAAKKAWLSSVVLMLGRPLNQQQNLMVDQVYVSDAALMAKHEAFCFPASIAKDLQLRSETTAMSQQALYQEAAEALRKHTLSNEPTPLS